MRTVVLLCVALAFGLALGACKQKGTAIAELTKAEGPVERQRADEPWQAAKLGTRYFLGDAARTADGAAQLEVAGGALIAMQPHTILRFGGTHQASKISVELGAIDLTGTGSYGFEIGDVTLSRNGTVRITAAAGRNTVELTLGEAQVTTAGGETFDLVIGKVVEIALDVAVTAMIDAGVATDAAAVAATDAGGLDAGGGDDRSAASLDVTGTTAELQLPGATKWTPLEAGAGSLPRGAK
ncbi:MAG: hypothetical protein M3680_10325, partial [Myxococcota bacterium]|nr:hypothetical protein [Myxococcota bacterium]